MAFPAWVVTSWPLAVLVLWFLNHIDPTSLRLYFCFIVQKTFISYNYFLVICHV